MIIFSDSRDPIFNSKDPNWVPKTPLKNPDYSLVYPACLAMIRFWVKNT